MAKGRVPRSGGGGPNAAKVADLSDRVAILEAKLVGLVCREDEQIERMDTLRQDLAESLALLSKQTPGGVSL